MKLKKYLALCIALLVFLSQSAFAEYITIEFKTLPDTITTNINAFPVTGRAPYTTNAVFVNDTSVALRWRYFLEVVDLSLGANTITLKVVDQNGSETIYSKQIIFDPAYSTESNELVYANIAYGVASGTEKSVVVVDVTNNTFLGIFKKMVISGITRDGSEIILDSLDGTSQKGIRYSTKTNSSTGRMLPSYYWSRWGELSFSNDGKKVYYQNYKVDLASNNIEGNLPATIYGNTAISDDDKKLFFEKGYIDLQTNTLFSRDYSQGIIAYWGDLAIDSTATRVLTSSYGWARGNVNILNADTNQRLATFSGGDYAGDIVFSPDKKKAYFGFYGNPDWGQGGIRIIDMLTLSSTSWFGLMGGGALTISKTGKIYSSKEGTGIVELTPIADGSTLQISKAFLVSPYYTRWYSNWTEGVYGIFFKPSTSIACYSNTDCGTEGVTGTPFCQNGNVYQSYITYTCNNPGTASSYCSNSTTPQLKQTCQYGCTAGACIGQPQPQGEWKPLLLHEPFESTASAQSNGWALNGSPQETSGKLGNALYFPGESGAMHQLNAAINSSNGTIEFWFNPEFFVQKGDAGIGLLEAGQLGQPNEMVLFIIPYYGKHIVIMEIRDDSGKLKQSWTSQVIVKENAWHHVAMAWQCNQTSNYARVFFDGKGGTTEKGACRYLNLSGPLRIAKVSGYYSKGPVTIDDLRIYSYVRSSSQIAKDAKYPKEVAHPTLIAPENGASTNNSSLFSWQANGFTKFKVEVSGDAAFSKPKAMTGWIYSTSTTLQKKWKTILGLNTADNDKVLYWRVLGQREYNQEYSEGRAFSIVQ